MVVYLHWTPLLEPISILLPLPSSTGAEYETEKAKERVVD